MKERLCTSKVDVSMKKRSHGMRQTKSSFQRSPVGTDPVNILEIFSIWHTRQAGVKLLKCHAVRITRHLSFIPALMKATWIKSVSENTPNKRISKVKQIFCGKK